MQYAAADTLAAGSTGRESILSDTTTGRRNGLQYPQQIRRAESNASTFPRHLGRKIIRCQNKQQSTIPHRPLHTLNPFQQANRLLSFSSSPFIHFRMASCLAGLATHTPEKELPTLATSPSKTPSAPFNLEKKTYAQEGRRKRP